MKVVLTGGGTAGHVIPAIEIGKTLKCKYVNIKLYYLGNGNHIEKQIAEDNGIEFHHVTSEGLESKRSPRTLFSFLKNNVIGIKDALKKLEEINPEFIIATGGFASSPVLFAAKMLKIPYYLQEQNKVLGKVNKLFLKNAEQIYYSFNNTMGSGKKTGKIFGNPTPIKKQIIDGEDVVVLGGSGGSEFLSDWAIDFAQRKENIKIHLQVGKKKEEEYKIKVDNLGLKNIIIYGFVETVELLSKAKIVVTRGGSSTLFELYNAKKTTIIVPLPYAAENHQYENGLEFQKKDNRFNLVEQKNSGKIDDMLLKLYYDSDKTKDNIISLKRINFKRSAENIAMDIYNDFYKKNIKKT